MPKILIVDDDVTITELIKALVSMEGHEPTTVNDSLQAVDIAKSVAPDLITLDLMMPEPDGFKLTRMLRTDPEFRRTPIISAKDDPDSKQRALEAGAKEYFTKPFGVDDFIGTISSLVRSGT